MAELLIYVSQQGHYEDGDILCAFNDESIQCRHLQHICFEKTNDRNRKWKNLNGAGLLNVDDLAQDFEEATRETRLERLAHNVCRLTVISTGESVEITSGIPFLNPYDNKIAQMDVAMYFNNKVKTLKSNGGNGQPVFGEIGSEIIYGGGTTINSGIITDIWTKVETKTPLRKTDEEFQLFPFGYRDIRSFLPVRTLDFTKEEMVGLTSPRYELDQEGNPVLDENDSPIILAKRNIKVDWANDLLGDIQETESTVRDPSMPVGRELMYRNNVNFRSKDQPVQASRAKLFSKENNSRLN